MQIPGARITEWITDEHATLDAMDGHRHVVTPSGSDPLAEDFSPDSNLLFTFVPARLYS